MIETLPDDDAVVKLQADAGLIVAVEKKAKASAINTRIQKTETAITQIRQDISFTKPHQTAENRTQRMQEEKKILGSYVSENPMDFYPSNDEVSIQPISDIYEGSTSCYGIISEIKLKKRRKDGKEMAFVTLEDGSGEIEVCVFTKAYGIFGQLLEEGKVVIFNGQTVEEVVEPIDEDDEPETVYKFYAESAEFVPEKALAIIMEVSSYALFHTTVEREFRAEFETTRGGRTLLIYDRALGEIRIATYMVKDSMLKLPNVRETVA